MSAPVDVLARIEACWGRNSAEYAAVAELVEAASDIPVEYDFHGKPASPELARFVAALAKFGGAE